MSRLKNLRRTKFGLMARTYEATIYAVDYGGQDNARLIHGDDERIILSYVNGRETLKRPFVGTDRVFS